MLSYSRILLAEASNQYIPRIMNSLNGESSGLCSWSSTQSSKSPLYTSMSEQNCHVSISRLLLTTTSVETVFKKPLALHSTQPLTGFMRTGYCEVPAGDFGNHSVAGKIRCPAIDGPVLTYSHKPLSPTSSSTTAHPREMTYVRRG